MVHGVDNGSGKKKVFFSLDWYKRGTWFGTWGCLSLAVQKGRIVAERADLVLVQRRRAHAEIGRTLPAPVCIQSLLGLPPDGALRVEAVLVVVLRQLVAEPR